MKIRYKKDGVEGFASQFNIHGAAEVIVNGDWGGDSANMQDLDIWLEQKQEWKDMHQAFNDRDIITDNFCIYFAEAKTQEDRVKGYYE